MPPAPQRGEVPLPVTPAVGAREDTLFLFAASGPGSYGSPGTDARGFTFDHAGAAAPAGWFGVDLTAQTGTWWHLASTAVCAGTGTDMSQAAPFAPGDLVNDYALWCGRQNVCGWSDPTGYGNQWQQTVVVDLSDQEIDQDLQVAFAYRSDFEGNAYDGFELRVEVAGEWETVYANYLTGDRSYRELSFTIPATELNGAGSGTRVGFHFVSDGGWSDEDGSYLSDVGALWLDNLQLAVDGQPAFSADFEDGLEPARLSFTTPAARRALCGALLRGLCIGNDSAAWALTWTPTTRSTRFRSWLWEVDQLGTHSTGPEDQRVERQTYYDLPLEPLIFTRNPAVAARTAADGCLRDFKRRNIVQYGPDRSGARSVSMGGMCNLDGAHAGFLSLRSGAVAGQPDGGGRLAALGVSMGSGGLATTYMPRPASAAGAAALLARGRRSARGSDCRRSGRPRWQRRRLVPWAGTLNLNGEVWSSMQADSARVGGVVEPGSFAFDFNDAYFEPGDVIEYFYRAQSQEGAVAAYPLAALAEDPAQREFWRVRCLPTAGARILVVEDSGEAADAWRLGLEHTNCPGYDLFTTQAPASGLNNGLGCRASAADLAGYSVLFWDSGSLSRYTLTGPGTSQLCTDTDLLLAWLVNAEDNSIAWIMGNSIASELSEDGSAALAQLLGAERILDGYSYFDLTMDLTPRVYGAHPAFGVGGLDPYFDVDGACPDIQYFDLVAPTGGLAESGFRWWHDGGSDAVAGVLNFDPDGDGTYRNAQGATAWVLYNPFSYGLLRDAGFDPGGYGLNYPFQLPYILACSFGTPPHFWCDTAAEEVPAAITTLHGAHPNPFNPKTTIRFSLAAPGRASLRVYDLAGRRMATLLDGLAAAGAQSIDWNGRDDAGRQLASGVYLLRFKAAGTSEESKLVLLK